jgi:hypothetical protein
VLYSVLEPLRDKDNLPCTKYQAHDKKVFFITRFFRGHTAKKSARQTRESVVRFFLCAQLSIFRFHFLNKLRRIIIHKNTVHRRS